MSRSTAPRRDANNHRTILPGVRSICSDQDSDSPWGCHACRPVLVLIRRDEMKLAKTCAASTGCMRRSDPGDFTAAPKRTILPSEPARPGTCRLLWDLRLGGGWNRRFPCKIAVPASEKSQNQEYFADSLTPNCPSGTSTLRTPPASGKAAQEPS